jgi:transcription-repair coupling factor (superfamily II helicase)
MSLIIPDDYVNEINERLNLYKKLDQLKSAAEIEEFKFELKDRFGEIPSETVDLIKTIEVREKAKKIGFEKLIIKNNKLVGKFTSRQPDYFESNTFSSVLNFVQRHKKGVQLKEKNNQLSLVIDGVTDIEMVSQIINKILNFMV